MMRRVIYSVLSIIFLVGLPAEAQPGDNAFDRPAISKTKRFSVHGLSAGENVEVGNWLEEIADKVSASITFDIPFKDGVPLMVTFVENETLTESRIIKQQRLTDFGVQQKLIVYNYDTLDREDLLEGAVGLLLNRFAIAKEPREARKARLVTAPDWFTVGCAQHLFKTTRDRNRSVVQGTWLKGEIERFGKLLELEVLPKGRWAEKASCGMLYAWFESRVDWTSMVPKLFDQWGHRRKVSADWLVVTLEDVQTDVDLEKYWDLWIATSRQVKSAEVDRAGQVSKLRKLMDIRPGSMGIPYPADAKPGLTWDELVGFREEPWFEPLTDKLLLEVPFTARGQMESYAVVVTAYEKYLLGLRKKRFAPSEKKLRKMLSAANHELLLYEEKLAARQKYLHQFMDKAPRAPEGSKPPDIIVPYRGFGSEPVGESIR